jgi:molybdopterin-guanine dinucleotide biosynthesis protein A
MEQSIKIGERSLRRFLEGINVIYINEEEVREIDPEGRSFININIMEDFQKEIGGNICLV